MRPTLDVNCARRAPRRRPLRFHDQRVHRCDGKTAQFQSRRGAGPRARRVLAKRIPGHFARRHHRGHRPRQAEPLCGLWRQECIVPESSGPLSRPYCRECRARPSRGTGRARRDRALADELCPVLLGHQGKPGLPLGLCFPSSFSIQTRATGGATDRWARNRSCRSRRVSSTLSADCVAVTWATPGALR